MNEKRAHMDHKGDSMDETGVASRWAMWRVGEQRAQAGRDEVRRPVVVAPDELAVPIGRRQSAPSARRRAHRAQPACKKNEDEDWLRARRK